MSGSHLESWHVGTGGGAAGGECECSASPSTGAQFTITFRRMGQYMLAAGDLLGRSQGVKLP